MGIKKNSISAISTANLLNFIGDGLQKCRQQLEEKKNNFPLWDLQVIKDLQGNFKKKELNRDMKKKITYDMALSVGAKKLHSGRKFMYDAVEATHKKYIGKNLFYKEKYLEKRNCPLCNSKKKLHYLKKEEVFTEDVKVVSLFTWILFLKIKNSLNIIKIYMTLNQ